MTLNNENNNDCCKCTIPEYEIILGAQGPQGRQGEKGEAGFTPIISVKDNTDSNYTLNILTQDGQITTPNLKANLPAGGATGQVLTKNSGEQDDCSWQNLPNATTEVEGIARLATEADFEATEDSAVSNTSIVTPALFNSEFKKQSSKFVTTNTEQSITGQKFFYEAIDTNRGILLRGAITARDKNNGINPNIIKYSNGTGNIILGETEQYPANNAMPMKNIGLEIRQFNDGNEAGLYTHKDTNVYPLLDSSNVIAGNNITIDKTSTGITISSTGGGELPDNVTTQGNTFNGANQLVQLDSSGKLPAIDGSQLTNLPSENQEIENIPAGGDFNDFLSTGIYFWGASGGILNNPNINMRGYLQVFRFQDSISLPVVQLYYTCDSTTTNPPEVWIRYCVNGSSIGYTWTTWNKVNDNSIPDNVVTSDTNTNLKIWTGTQTEYDAITTKDISTIYAIKEV